MRYLFILCLPLLLITCAQKENNISDATADIAFVKNQLNNISEIKDDSVREVQADLLWDSLSVNDIIPVTSDTTVLFLYRGEAESVSWNGDFNSWGNDPSIENEGSRVVGTKIWVLKQHFPSDTRLDYKITIDDQNWILDTANPHQQWSGFGPNSELRMPDWQPDPMTVYVSGADVGKLSNHKIINSTNLGYEVQYRVYIPNGYEQFSDLPVLYITDGHEYSSDSLGATKIVLDNLIRLKRIEPMIAVFVDPRNPENLEINRRAEEFGMNENYLNFYTEELIPLIESNYKVISENSKRAILGTSLGGLNATYFAFSRPDIFGKAAIQSPAYLYRENIFDLVRNFDGKEPDIFMSSGTFNDVMPVALEMEIVFQNQGFDYTFVKVNDGHSWGAWRSQLDEILIQFFGNGME